MIPSERAFALFGVATLLFAGAVAAPWLVALGVLADLLVLVLVVVDARRAPPVAVVREAPEVMHQGEPAEVRLRLAGRIGARVRVREVVPPALGEAVTAAATLGDGTAEVGYSLVPARRGAALLPAPGVRSLGPWGLGWREQPAEGPETRVRVYPQARLPGDAGLYLREVLERRPGANPLRLAGLSTEIRALRDWRTGDDARRIHWKATARMHRPVVRETDHEQHQRVIIMVDAGRAMSTASGSWSKLDHALAATLAFARVVLAREDQAVIVLFSREIRRVVHVDRHTAAFLPVFEALHAEAADADEPDYPKMVAWCAERVPRRSLAVLLTSVIDPLSAHRVSSALAGLARRHRTLLVNLEDPGIAQAARRAPDDVDAAFMKVSAMRIREGMRALEARLGATGVDVLTLDASRLAMGMIRRYLELKERRGI